MVLVDVDIDDGDNDGHAYRLGYSINGTGFTLTAEYLDNSDPNSISVNTQQSRYLTISATNNKTDNNESRGWFLFKGITIPIGSTIDDATLNVTGTTSQGGDVRVYGRLTASPTTPTGTIGSTIFTKPLGTAFGTTTFSSGTFAPVAIDMQAVIQELVNTFDYNNDNMMLIMKANSNTLPTTPVSTDVSNSVQVRPFEFGGGVIPNLTINYTLFKVDFTIDAILESMPTAQFTISAQLEGKHQFLRPIADITKGSFTDIKYGNNDGDLWDEMDEINFDDTISAISGKYTGDPTPAEFRLTSIVDPNASFGHIIRTRMRKDPADGSVTIIQLFQGTTLIAQDSFVLTDSYVTFEFTLTEAQANSITDYSDLRIRIEET